MAISILLKGGLPITTLATLLMVRIGRLLTTDCGFSSVDLF